MRAPRALLLAELYQPFLGELADRLQHPHSCDARQGGIIRGLFCQQQALANERRKPFHDFGS